MSSYFSEEEKKNSTNLNNESIANKSFFEKFEFYYNHIKDKIIIYKAERWGAVAVLAIIYFIRMFRTKGYYALTYCIGIHFLNSFIGFISPLDDPEDYDLNSGDSFLPQKNDEEFKPFQRKIKEFAFWSQITGTLFVAIIMTYSRLILLRAQAK